MNKEVEDQMINKFDKWLKEMEETKLKKEKVYHKIKEDFNITIDKIFSDKLNNIVKQIIEKGYYDKFTYETDVEVYNEFMEKLIYDLIEKYKLNLVISPIIHFPLHLHKLYNHYNDIEEAEHYIVKYNNEFYILEIIDVRYTGPFNKRFFIETLDENINTYATDIEKSIVKEFKETFIDVMKQYIIEIKEK